VLGEDRVWAWDPARLDELIRAAAPATLFACGGADNQQEVADRFTQVFLLEIDEPTMLARLDARRDYPRLDWPSGTRHSSVISNS
jgi:hypothetical protein